MLSVSKSNVEESFLIFIIYLMYAVILKTVLTLRFRCVFFRITLQYMFDVTYINERAVITMIKKFGLKRRR